MAGSRVSPCHHAGVDVQFVEPSPQGRRYEVTRKVHLDDTDPLRIERVLEGLEIEGERDGKCFVVADRRFAER